MKIIFLDFDGVITTKLSNFKIDRDKVSLLNTLILETDAKVVVSSMWRYLEEDPVRNLQAELEKHGFTGEIIDITNRCFERRGQEIDDWIDSHDIDRYIVFDDEIGEILGYQCADFLIETKIDEGLTEEVIGVASALLL